MLSETQDGVLHVDLCQGEPHEHGGHGEVQPLLEIYCILA